MYIKKGYFNVKLTEEDKANILEWGKQGKRIRDIVELLDGKITKQRVSQLLKKAGIANTEIWRENKVKEKLVKLEKKYGKQFFEKDKRRDVIYQIARDKFRNKKYNAISAGIEWSIDFGDLEFPVVCPVLGIEIDYWAESRKENSLSFDRIDNSKGYVKGNVTLMSWRANRIKNDGTAEEHKKIYEFMQKSLTSPD